MKNEIQLGKHLLLQLMGCDLKILADRALIREALLNCVKLTNAKVVAETFHNFSPQGITGVVVIEESHVSIHTWPEYQAAVVDFFTCNLNCDFEVTVKFLKSFFKAREVTFDTISRKIPH